MSTMRAAEAVVERGLTDRPGGLCLSIRVLTTRKPMPFHDDEGRAGDEALGLQQPINTGFRDKGLLAIGERDSHFARAEFRLVERVCDDLLTDLVGDAVPDAFGSSLAILECFIVRPSPLILNVGKCPAGPNAMPFPA